MAPTPGPVEHFVYNAVGHTTALTNGAGAVTQTSLYEAFGDRVASSGSSTNNRLANTKERDASLGLDNHGFRYYDPETGRYITRDPIGYGDGMNVYQSVGSNPINGIDPLGLQEEQGTPGGVLQETGRQLRAASETGLAGVMRGPLATMVQDLQAQRVEAYGSRTGNYRSLTKLFKFPSDLDLLVQGSNLSDSARDVVLSDFEAKSGIKAHVAFVDDAAQANNYKRAINEGLGPTSFVEISPEGMAAKPSGTSRLMHGGGKALGFAGFVVDAVDIATAEDPGSRTLQKAGGWAGAYAGAKVGAVGYGGGPILGTITTLGGAIAGGILGEEAVVAA